MYNNFMEVVNKIPLKRGVADIWEWTTAKDGRFNTKDAYICISNLRGEEEDGRQMDRKLCTWTWDNIAMIKGAAIAWKSVRKRLPTRANLRRRNIPSDNEDLSCPICKDKPETEEHLILECGGTYMIWYACYKWLSLQGIVLNNLGDHLHYFCGLFRGKKAKRIGNAI